MGIPGGSQPDLGLLMELAQAGDEAAYLLLLRRITSIVRNAVKQKINASQHADMEDVVQDVLVSVHVVRATYDPSRPFLPWLLSIVHHRTVDKFRKSARIAANETHAGELLETLAGESTNSQAITFGDDELLRREIAALPSSQRRAVELLKLKEMSLKEAARESGMTVASLKISVHRAMKTLRKRIVAGHGG